MVAGVSLETNPIGHEMSNQQSKKQNSLYTTNLDRHIGSKLIEEVVQ